MKKRPKNIFLIVDILLLLVSIVCLIATCENNRKINHLTRSRHEFIYRETKPGEVWLCLGSGKEVALRFGDASVKIVHSYQLHRREELYAVVLFIREYAAVNGYSISRKNTELFGEYRLHNLLYRLGVKRAQTADADLEYMREPRWYVSASSKCLGWIGI